MTLNIELIRATVHAVVEAAAASAPMPELVRKYATGLMDTVVTRLYDSGVQVNHGVKNAVFRELAAIKTANGGGPVPEWLLG